jgi:caa(3)-type oxidase subunit IV
MTDAARASTTLYLAIWGWLAGLMLLGVVVSELPILPLARGQIVGLVVVFSTVKATLVALYYMHLKGDRRLLALVALAPFVLIALALGVVLSSALVRL